MFCMPIFYGISCLTAGYCVFVSSSSLYLGISWFGSWWFHIMMQHILLDRNRFTCKLYLFFFIFFSRFIGVNNLVLCLHGKISFRTRIDNILVVMNQLITCKNNHTVILCRPYTMFVCLHTQSPRNKMGIQPADKQEVRNSKSHSVQLISFCIVRLYLIFSNEKKSYFYLFEKKIRFLFSINDFRLIRSISSSKAKL